MDNAGVALVLGEIADLLDIKGENSFKVRAYRNAAELVLVHPTDLVGVPVDALREIPGIGKDLAVRIADIASTGDTAVHRELLAELPASLLALLQLQGMGPKTVGRLHSELGVTSLDTLEAAAQAGRIRALSGMGPKKEALILKALEEHRQHAGRHLLADTAATAEQLVQRLRAAAPEAVIDAVGSLRRGAETCGDIDILVTGADGGLMDTFVSSPGVDRVLAHGTTKSSVALANGFQADLRLVPRESHGAAMQYFTGSKAHNIALRDRAIALGLKLNEYGLFKASDGTVVAGATEAEVYAALGLAWVPPELREDRGELAAAESGTLPGLVDAHALRGDLHMHTTESDGRDSIEAMAAAAHAVGFEYIAITDHSKALAMANGLDETRALAHAARVRAADGAHGVRLLAGIEVDIMPDGSLDLSDDCLGALDIVVASVHSAFTQDRQQMTDRLLRAIANPNVDIIGHPSGRLLLQRAPYQYDLDAVLKAAAAAGVAMEINSQPSRIDLNDTQARAAKAHGVALVISSDAHSRQSLGLTRWGVVTARRAWLTPSDILNTRPFADFRASLRRHRP